DMHASVSVRVLPESVVAAGATAGGFMPWRLLCAYESARILDPLDAGAVSCPAWAVCERDAARSPRSRPRCPVSSQSGWRHHSACSCRIARGWHRRIERDDAPPECDTDRFGPVSDVELAVNGLRMELDGAIGDKEAVGDLLVAQSAHQHLQH